MAIKVNGTTVISDSRALTNITSVDATTVAALGTAGVGGGFEYVSVSGSTQNLNLNDGNLFDAGTLTTDTTLTFSNVPTEALWSYTYEAGIGGGAYELNTNVAVGKKYLGDDDPYMNAVFVKPDGSKIYTTGNNTDSIYEYDVVSGNVSTMSLNQSQSISTWISQPAALFFKPDGTKVYVSNTAENRIYEFNLSTAWDISTLSYDSYYITGYQGTPYGIHIDPSGTRLYMASYNTDIYQYSLSTAWDISTASFVRSEYVGWSSTQDVQLSSDGTIMVIMSSYDGVMRQYNLSTPWNINTRGDVQFTLTQNDLNLQYASDLNGFCFNSNGSMLYPVTNREVGQFSLGIGAAITLPSSVVKPSSTPIAIGNRVTQEYLTADGGTNVYIINETVM